VLCSDTWAPRRAPWGGGSGSCGVCSDGLWCCLVMYVLYSGRGCSISLGHVAPLWYWVGGLEFVVSVVFPRLCCMCVLCVVPCLVVAFFVLLVCVCYWWAVSIILTVVVYFCGVVFSNWFWLCVLPGVCCPSFLYSLIARGSIFRHVFCMVGLLWGRR